MKNKQKSKQKVTMNTIAMEMGVSRNTVFKAIKNKEGISKDLREKIIQKSKELGYTPLNSLKEKNIVILVKREFFLDQTYFAKIFVGIEEAKQENHKIIFTIIDNDNTNFVLSNYVDESKTDGIIVAGRVDDIVLNQINDKKIPFVMIDHYDENCLSDIVIMMNKKGIVDAVNLLVKNGHKKIGFIGNLNMYNSFEERYDAYIYQMKKLNLPINPKHIFTAGDIPFWDLHHLKNIFDNINNYPTAFICANDRIAIAVIKYFTERGINIPNDISIVGFDNTDESLMCIPSLTTVDVPKTYMGKKAMELLLWRINNLKDPKVQLNIEVKIEERNSIKKLN